MNNCIVRARTATEFNAGRRLFNEHTTALGVDFVFQNYEREVREIDVQYNAPHGRLFLVVIYGCYVGCAGVRRLQNGVCELKRMYLQPGHRGRGLGAQLLQACIAAARDMGYTAIRLDTLPTMASAMRLYLRAGFYEIPAYYNNPHKDVRYFELKL